MAQSANSTYTFDLEAFRREFPIIPVSYDLAQLGDVCGPSALVEIEHYRHILGAHLFDVERRPVDVFTWSIGEPPDRHVTKIGGVPYRSAELPWPTSPNGAPRCFLAQFCFTDSVFPASGLPGCTLLIFVDDTYSDDWNAASFYLEWQPAGLTHLVSERELPPRSIELPSLFGVRHRSIDLVSPLPEEALEGVVTPFQLEFQTPAEVAWNLACFDATKIGGVPAFPLAGSLGNERLLCSLISMFPSIGVRFPYVNHEAACCSMSELPSFSPGGGYFRLAVALSQNGRMTPHFHYEYC
ncbi:MAG: DUF1963 domain-containing protein [Pirellulales bacterium]